MKDGRLVLARGYGYADLENSVPANAETVYRLGSITKQFTAMAIMQLAEQGKLSVDDELTKFLPDYPLAGHKVTVHQLLNHTSGIKSYTSTKDFFSARGRISRTTNCWRLFKDEPFDFEPGAKWRYNNSGYYLLGMIIEKASGQTYAEYLEEHIFQASGHERHALRPYAAADSSSRHGLRYRRAAMSQRRPDQHGRARRRRALVSNVLDLIKWHQALESR